MGSHAVKYEYFLPNKGKVIEIYIPLSKISISKIRNGPMKFSKCYMAHTQRINSKDIIFSSNAIYYIGRYLKLQEELKISKARLPKLF